MTFFLSWWLHHKPCITVLLVVCVGQRFTGAQTKVPKNLLTSTMTQTETCDFSFLRGLIVLLWHFSVETASCHFVYVNFYIFFPVSSDCPLNYLWIHHQLTTTDPVTMMTQFTMIKKKYLFVVSAQCWLFSGLERPVLSAPRSLGSRLITLGIELFCFCLL